MKQLIGIVAGAAAGLLALPSAGLAQDAADYGSRPIRLVVPVTPGGGTDIIARIVAAGLESSGLRMVVDNRPGAGGMIGSELVARATPDGYTLLFPYASHTTMPFMSRAPYDPDRDFTPVTLVGTNPLLVTVNPSVPATDIKELIALAKAKGKGLNVGIASSGSAGHLAAELFKVRTGTSDGIVSVVYKGSGPALVALMSGEVQLIFGSVPPTLPYVKAGKAKVIATIHKKRVAEFPDVPTFAELGIDVDVAPWQGIMGPAKMPRPVVMRIYTEVSKMLKRPDIVKRFAASGNEPVGSTPEEFAEKIRRELKEFGEIIPKIGLKAR